MVLKSMSFLLTIIEANSNEKAYESLRPFKEQLAVKKVQMAYEISG